jgi:hypothetical protein
VTSDEQCTTSFLHTGAYLTKFACTVVIERTSTSRPTGRRASPVPDHRRLEGHGVDPRATHTRAGPASRSSPRNSSCRESSGGQPCGCPTPPVDLLQQPADRRLARGGLPTATNRVGWAATRSVSSSAFVTYRMWKEVVPCRLTETRRVRPEFSARAGWKDSATACSESPSHCWSWASHCIPPARP